MPPHLDPQFDHAGNGAAIDHDIVHCQYVEYTVAVSHHARVHEAAAILDVFPAKHGRQGCPEFFQ